MNNFGYILTAFASLGWIIFFSWLIYNDWHIMKIRWKIGFITWIIIWLFYFLWSVNKLI
jgi:hypothetical protein